MPFDRNESLVQAYVEQANAHGAETLLNFGAVPVSREDEEDWEAAANVFMRALSSRGYVLQPARYDGHSGACPLYTVRRNAGEQQDTPVQVDSLESVVRQFCREGQRTEVHGRVLDVHVLGDL